VLHDKVVNFNLSLGESEAFIDDRRILMMTSLEKSITKLNNEAKKVPNKGNIQGTFSEHPVNIQGTSREHPWRSVSWRLVGLVL
jgi:hypothetical protein